jgi:hypothetical protein
VATNRHEINIQIININMHLACCLSRICMKEDVLGLAQFSCNKLNNFIQSHAVLTNQPQKCLHTWPFDYGGVMQKNFPMITRCCVVIVYRRFGTTYRSHLQGPRVQGKKKVGKQLPHNFVHMIYRSIYTLNSMVIIISKNNIIWS